MTHDAANQGEQAMVAAAIAGDRQAMARLWRTHRQWIAAVVLMHKPREIDLEDLLQEVALTVVNKIHTLHEHDNIKAWLRTVAVNAARAAGRSVSIRRRYEHNGALNESDDAPSADEALVRSEYGRWLLQCLRELPENYREPLALRAMQGLSSRQIGEILDLSEAAVDTRIARVRTQLRAKLESDQEDANQSEMNSKTQARQAQGVRDA